MALKTTISNAVDSAFVAVQDLAEDVSFTNNTAQGYNFDTGVVEETAGTTTTVQGIFTGYTKQDSNNLVGTIIFKSSEVSAVELDNYDQLTWRSQNWNINNIEDNGFSTTVTIVRTQ